MLKVSSSSNDVSKHASHARWLLGFTDKSAEDSFRNLYCFRRRYVTMFALFLAAPLYCIFYLWDIIIDSRHADVGYSIRVYFVAPFLVLVGSLLIIKRFDRFHELLGTGAGIVAVAGLAYIYSALEKGFDYGAVGPVLVTFFLFSLMSLRFSYYIFYCATSLLLFNSAQYLSTSSSDGMLFVNNLCILTSYAFGLFSAATREFAERREFVINATLHATKVKLDETNASLQRATDHLINASRAYIFLSYRRSDSSAITGRIKDRLVGKFGGDAIFIDIDNIPFGLDFREQIKLGVRNAKVILVVIGKDWFGSTNDEAVRLDSETDPVRLEVEMALGEGIRIVPLLVEGAQMPSSELLPASIRELTYRNALQIDAGRDFELHMNRLVQTIEKAVADTSSH